MNLRLGSRGFAFVLFLLCIVPTGRAYAATLVTPSALVTLTNADRTNNGDRMVTEDAALDAAAQNQAKHMAAEGYFAHVSPEQQQPWYWLKQIHYYYWAAGQNLAQGFQNATDIETAWMNSPAHRTDILQAQYTRVGFGIAEGMYQGKKTTFVVAFFAKPVAMIFHNTTPPFRGNVV